MSDAEALAKKLRRTKNKRPFGRDLIWRCQMVRMRTELGLSLRDVEAAIGVSNATLSHVERGTDLTLSTAVKIVKFFGCTIEEMWPEWSK